MNAASSDITLLKAWQRHRDAEAFHTLVTRHARLVFTTCRHIVRNDADAADVSQECFLSLATTPPEIERSLAGWLHRLATHRALNHLKQQQRRREREVRYAQGVAELVHPDSDDLLSLIDETIDALPDDLRVPLIDHFFGQKSHQEVALILGLPRRTVSYRINNGIEQLRTMLHKRGVTAPVAGVAALLEWQRAEAESIPEDLFATLGKFALAGSARRHTHRPQATAFASAGLSGVVLVVLCLLAVVGAAAWLFSGNRFPWRPVVTPVVTEDVRETASSGQKDEPPPSTNSEVTAERAVAVATSTEGIAGKVTGRVYDADTDAPIAGAEVKIAKDSDTHSPVATCTTNLEGQFESGGLPAGAYMIYRGKTPGYGATSERINAGGTWLSNPEVDGVRFLLSRDMAIDLPVHRGLVVSGIVVDTLGNGIANANVVARARYQNNGQTTQTAADGSFSLAGFSTTYNLCMSVSKPGYGRRNFSRLDIGFPGLKDLRVEMYPESRISGQVMKEDGTPLADARIIAIHDADALRWPLGFSGADTNAEGKYSINGLGAGRYGVQVFSGDKKIRGIDPKAAFVDLDAGQSVDNVNLRTPTPKGVTVSGIVTDPNGEPIRNQVISLGLPTSTDDAGRFAIAGLSIGPHQFMAEVDGYRTGFEKVFVDGTLDPETAMQKRGFVAIDRDRVDLHFVLYPNTFTLTGRVVNAGSGEAMKYFELGFFPQGAIPHTTEAWQEARRIFSEDGTFRLDNLPLGSGSWSVVAWIPGFGVGITDFTTSPDSNEAELMIKVLEGINVSGFVFDHVNKPIQGAEIIFGPPFESRVAVTGSDGSFKAFGLPASIQAKGSRNPVGPEPAAAKLAAFHTDFAPVSAPIPAQGDKTPIIFRFEPAGTIDVRISRLGKPVTMASVMALRSSESLTPCMGVPDKSVSDDGSTRFTGVPAGHTNLFIQVASSAGAPIQLDRPVEVVAGQVTPVQIELDGEFVSIQGSFLLEGQPMESARVSYTTSGETAITVGANNISTDGIWKMDEVTVGSGTLLIVTNLDKLSIERSLPLNLKPGASTTIDINHGGIGDEAEEAGKIQGTLSVEGTAPKRATAVYTVTKGDTVLTYSQSIFSTNYDFSPDGDLINIDPELPADTAIEWTLEEVAAGDGVLTITVESQDDEEYEYSADLLLAPDETHKLEIALTSDDKKVDLL